MYREEMKNFEVTETSGDTRTRLSNKTDKELIKFLIDVNKSIKSGFEYAIYYQEWSVGIDILRKRGYVILRPSELEEIAKNLNIQ